ncbi:MgtC/SapB family protein [Alkanindiges illinoisensis]|uniref:Protein MgtC n=1 Tax=Alkanindiges illinoisensis TaxID=197183 RepID=A0A4Y7XBF3_9GAMM|nr:MgtC/SapB family protein [Alkanindiges illinoisensis]TEU25602.1 MgtC/SapB family protein [Alkanindiges illinoisensis]
MFEFDFNLTLMAYHLFQLGIAFVLSLPIALNREMKDSGAGLRTFPLVTIASCAFMLVGRDMYQGSDAEARVMYAIITGMGFIGGGAIFKSEAGVKGTATAASLWNTGAIGISVAYGRYEIAVILSMVSFLILHFSERFKAKDKP